MFRRFVRKKGDFAIGTLEHDDVLRQIWIAPCRGVNLQVSQLCVITQPIASEKLEFRHILRGIPELLRSISKMSATDMHHLTISMKRGPTREKRNIRKQSPSGIEIT
jgi:hypothetical protein